MDWKEWCASLAMFVSGGLLAITILNCQPDSPYIDGTEANELLDKGFRIFDESGEEVEFFSPDGFHHRYSDPAPTNVTNASAAEFVA